MENLYALWRMPPVDTIIHYLRHIAQRQIFLKVMSEYFFAILVTKNWTGRPGFDSQCCGMRHHSSVTEHSVCYFVVAILQHKKLYIF